jgi:hypothetical protein
MQVEIASATTIALISSNFGRDAGFVKLNGWLLRRS